MIDVAVILQTELPGFPITPIITNQDLVSITATCGRAKLFLFRA